jgi:hypothetical protein
LTFLSSLAAGEKFADISLHSQLDLRALNRKRSLKREANLIGLGFHKGRRKSPVLFRKSEYIDSHIQLRQGLKTCEPAACKFLSSLLVTEESLEIGGGKLDEGLEEVPLFGVVARCVPKTFKDFVAFPPVGEVVEIDSVSVVL